jgi:broad specificity phosphatase PhoE
LKIIAVRHGNTGQPVNGNDRKRELTPLGHWQAGSIGKQLAKRGIVPDIAFISPVLRVRQTTEGILSSDRTCPVIEVPTLYEHPHEGTRLQIDEMFTGLGYATLKQYRGTFGELRFSYIRAMGIMNGRSITTIRGNLDWSHIALAPKLETVLIVGHAVIIPITIHELLSRNAKWPLDLNMTECETIIFDTDRPEGFIILKPTITDEIPIN